MKNIIIIAPRFAPNNTIAAIRPTKLAKYFKLNNNCDITVVTRELISGEISDPTLYGDIKYIDNYITVNFITLAHRIGIRLLKIINKTVRRNRPNVDKGTKLKAESISPKIKQINNKHRKKQANLCTTIFDYVSGKIIYCDEANFYKRAIKLINKQPGEYDVVFSTFCPMVTHMVAYNIKKCNHNTCWIADFRDPPFVTQTKKSLITYYEASLRKILEMADIITGISDGCLVDFREKCDEKLHVITNGFDRNDLSGIEAVPSDKFTLTYTGTLLKDRSIIIIIMALRELIDEGRVDKNKLLINYAGNSEGEFMNQIAQYDLLDIVENHGFIARRKSLELQMSSNILVLLSWNSIGSEGVITGKFLEYLMIDKPIICTITGNLANSKLKEMITAANNGVVWEEANGDADYPVLKSYILEQYERFIRGEPLLFEPNREYIEQYNYKNITQQYIDLIEEHFSKRDKKDV